MTDIDALLRRAEMQQKQMELNLRFEKNMAVFKEQMPSVYKQYKDYQPEELRLSFDNKNRINLVNHKLNNKPVYDADPESFAKAQVESFIANPMVSSMNFSFSEAANPKHFHADLINEVLKEKEDFVANFDTLGNTPIGMLVMTGCGLGYQIPDLLDKLNIYNLCIVDPHTDSFFASLHTIDWAPIVKYFQQPYRHLIICPGNKPESAMQIIKAALGESGLHTGIYTFIYRHFNSREENNFIELYKKKFHLSAFGLGFAEDEQISFAHTIANIRNKTPILNNRAIQKSNVPAFIIGNGPSLDGLLEFIQAHNENAVLFSCGSAASSLSKAGVNTDFHVEMERSRVTTFWLESGTTEEFRNNASLLALNTVHPDTFSLFPKGYMAIKANDMGEILVVNEFTNMTLPPLKHCNPTVTNCAAAYAIELGFTEIYLFGVDLGMADPEKHHSDNSIHHDIQYDENASEEDKKRYTYSKDTYKVKGNLIDSVYTDNVLDSSRISFELLLESKKNVNIYNPNNGAFIRGSIPLKPTKIPKPTVVGNKEKMLENLLNNKFSVADASKMTDQHIMKTYINDLALLRKLLELPEKVDGKKALLDQLNLTYKIITASNKTLPISQLLLRGSINSYFGLLSKYCLATKDDSELNENYQIVKFKYHKFLNNAFNMIENSPLQLDDSEPTVILKKI